MNTGDDETRRYFKHSCVKVLLCPRKAGKGSWAKKQVGFFKLLYSLIHIVVSVESPHLCIKILIDNQWCIPELET